MEKLILGIDVGTTGTKTVLFSEENGMLSQDYMGYELITSATDFREHRPSDYWEAVVKTVRGAISKAGIKDTSKVAAISLSAQGGTLIPTDENFVPTANAIVWLDKRAAAESAEFKAKYGPTYIYEKTGWNLGNGLCAMEIAWLKDNAPEVFKKTKYFLSVADYICALLTGKAVVDYSDAGINQLIDIHERKYDPTILSFLGLDEKAFASLAYTGEVVGNITKKAADELGLTTDTVFVTGAHDQYAVTNGAGCFLSGDVIIGSGTAWVVTALSKDFHFDKGFSQSISAVKGLKGSLVSLSSGGMCLEWLRTKLANKDDEAFSYDEINKKAYESGIGAKGLFFYPYFSGAPYPVKDPGQRGSLWGMDFSQDRYDIARAVMEGVAFHIGWILEGFLELFPVNSIKLAGGASKSKLWSQIVADITGVPVVVPQMADLACVGAAIIAGVGAGIYDDPKAGYSKLAVPDSVIEPIEENVKQYNSLKSEWKSKLGKN